MLSSPPPRRCRPPALLQLQCCLSLIRSLVLSTALLSRPTLFSPLDINHTPLSGPASTFLSLNFCPAPHTEYAKNLLKGTGPSKRLNAEQQRVLSSPMKELDTILALLAAAAPVDVMPGEISQGLGWIFGLAGGSCLRWSREQSLERS